MFTYLWITWVLLFVLIEAVALFNDLPEDTLSEHLRKWFSTHEKLGRTVWIAVSVIFSVWFVIHIGWVGTI